MPRRKDVTDPQARLADDVRRDVGKNFSEWQWGRRITHLRKMVDLAKQRSFKHKDLEAASKCLEEWSKPLKYNHKHFHLGLGTINKNLTDVRRLYDGSGCFAAEPGPPGSSQEAEGASVHNEKPETACLRVTPTTAEANEAGGESQMSVVMTLAEWASLSPPGREEDERVGVADTTVQQLLRTLQSLSSQGPRAGSAPGASGEVEQAAPDVKGSDNASASAADRLSMARMLSDACTTKGYDPEASFQAGTLVTIDDDAPKAGTGTKSGHPGGQSSTHASQTC